MPSPTSRTRPTSLTVMPSRYWLISAVRTETISSALNLMTASLDELTQYLLKLGADRAVVDVVARLHHQAANQFGVYLDFQDRFRLQSLTQFVLQAILLVAGQGHCR